MNGQLSEHPLAELIREISAKSLGGRLRLEHDRVKVVAYFDSGNFLYAASNLRTLRLHEYLLKGNVMREQDLAPFNDRVSDADLIKALCSQNLMTLAVAEQIQTKQVSDVLRLALLWTEGKWEFESGLRLNEYLNLNIDACSLLLDAGRRMPETFAASRFIDPAEVISPVESLQLNTSLLPAEVFLLSRLDKPMVLRELIAISGLGEAETLQIVYSLVLAGLIKREHWKSAFRDRQPAAQKTAKETTPVAKPAPEMAEPEIAADDVESFLERMRNAQTHYDVLGVTTEVPTQNLKTVYYQLAKRYHPDRFRKAEPSVVTRLEAAFARITQAYDTLHDDALRSRYDAKLENRKKAKQLAESAPKAATHAPQPEQAVESSAEPSVSAAERAEIQFKEGFAALGMGQRKEALGLLASAASAAPKEARYRAFYGHALAGDERTRRAAEAELNAAIRLEPANAEYRVMLAELYRDLGLKLRAKGEAERAIAADPNNRKARELLSTLK